LASKQKWAAINETTRVLRRNDIMKQVNQLIIYVSRTIPFRSDLDGHLIRAAMVFTFFAFSIQKWSQYTAEMLVPLISHSPVVFWLLPAFGVRGAGYFLGTTETIFGTLIFLGYWSPRLGILGALGSIVTFIGTTSIIPFLPDGWAHEAGGFPIMTTAARLSFPLAARPPMSATPRESQCGAYIDMLASGQRAAKQKCSS